MLQPGDPCVSDPAVRDQVVQDGWSAGDTREVRVGVGVVGTYSVKYEVMPKELRLYFEGI